MNNKSDSTEQLIAAKLATADVKSAANRIAEILERAAKEIRSIADSLGENS